MSDEIPKGIDVQILKVFTEKQVEKSTRKIQKKLPKKFPEELLGKFENKCLGNSQND